MYTTRHHGPGRPGRGTRRGRRSAPGWSSTPPGPGHVGRRPPRRAGRRRPDPRGGRNGRDARRRRGSGLGRGRRLLRAAAGRGGVRRGALAGPGPRARPGRRPGDGRGGPGPSGPGDRRDGRDARRDGPRPARPACRRPGLVAAPGHRGRRARRRRQHRGHRLLPGLGHLLAPVAEAGLLRYLVQRRATTVADVAATVGFLVSEGARTWSGRPSRSTAARVSARSRRCRRARPPPSRRRGAPRRSSPPRNRSAARTCWATRSWWRGPAAVSDGPPPCTWRGAARTWCWPPAGPGRWRRWPPRSRRRAAGRGPCAATSPTPRTPRRSVNAPGRRLTG